jgi:hypothetical protein
MRDSKKWFVWISKPIKTFYETKIIIGFSVALLLLAVFLIARDLFHNSPSFTATSCCEMNLPHLNK